MSGSFNLNRQNLELRGQNGALLLDPTQRRRRRRRTGDGVDVGAPSAGAGADAGAGAGDRQESWFRHSMPPAINRDFESIENLVQTAADGLDGQLASSLSGKLGGVGGVGGVSAASNSGNYSGGGATACGSTRTSTGGIHLNSANSNLGFIDSDESNTQTPVSPLPSTFASIYQQQQQLQQQQPQYGSASTSVAGTISSGTAGGGNGQHRKKGSGRRKGSKGSMLSKQSGNSVRSRISALAARGLRITASFLRQKRKEYDALTTPTKVLLSQY